MQPSLMVLYRALITCFLYLATCASSSLLPCGLLCPPSSRARGILYGEERDIRGRSQRKKDMVRDHFSQKRSTHSQAQHVCQSLAIPKGLACPLGPAVTMRSANNAWPSAPPYLTALPDSSQLQAYQPQAYYDCPQQAAMQLAASSTEPAVSLSLLARAFPSNCSKDRGDTVGVASCQI